MLVHVTIDWFDSCYDVRQIERMKYFCGASTLLVQKSGAKKRTVRKVETVKNPSSFFFLWVWNRVIGTQSECQSPMGTGHSDRTKETFHSTMECMTSKCKPTIKRLFVAGARKATKNFVCLNADFFAGQIRTGTTSLSELGMLFYQSFSHVHHFVFWRCLSVFLLLLFSEVQIGSTHRLTFSFNCVHRIFKNISTSESNVSIKKRIILKSSSH